MVGSIDLKFTVPLTGIDTKLPGHKVLKKLTFKHIVSSLLSTPVRKNDLKRSVIYMFFDVL